MLCSFFTPLVSDLQVAWNTESYKALSAQDNGKRAELVIAQLRSLKPHAVHFATAEHVSGADALINLALAARLFTTHSGLTPGTKQIAPLQNEMEELVSTFKGLGDVMRAMRFSAHRWEEAESLEVEMRDTGTTSRKVRGKDMWRGRGVGTGLRNVSDFDPDVVDRALDGYGCLAWERDEFPPPPPPPPPLFSLSWFVVQLVQKTPSFLRENW